MPPPGAYGSLGLVHSVDFCDEEDPGALVALPQKGR